MTLLLTMLPFYLIGNLHCLGMCGPLVMMIGHHRFRLFYFFGRLLSFTLAGAFAGGAGEVISIFLKAYHISEAASLFFGFTILMLGVFSLIGKHYPGYQWMASKTKPLNQQLTLLMLQDKPLASFLFGFFTVSLPCGQTLIVFSACAVAGDFWIGLLNGLSFALLTSPSLFLAMHAHRFLFSCKGYYQLLLGLSALFIGSLSICRGFAEMGFIPHLILPFHIVVF